jgi:hypothetical protein
MIADNPRGNLYFSAEPGGDLYGSANSSQFDVILVIAIAVAGVALGLWLFGKSEEKQLPPSSAEWLLTLLVSRRKADGLLGDLEERFYRNCKNRGPRRARWLYWAETLRSIAPLLWSAAKRIGVVAVVAAAARRFLSWPRGASCGGTYVTRH